MRDFPLPNLKHVWRRLLPAALALLIGGMGGPMMAAPTFRLAEMNEHLPAKERSEILSAAGRFDQQRQVRFNHGPMAIMLVCPPRPLFGRATSTVFDGHRLSNGLLAPLTC